MMRSLRPLLSLVGGLIGTVYCFGLALYLHGVSFGTWMTRDVFQLRPTIIGLIVVGLLFALPLIIKLVLAALASRPPRVAGVANGAVQEAFDADAALARYMARRGDEQPLAPGDRARFGRRRFPADDPDRA